MIFAIFAFLAMIVIVLLAVLYIADDDVPPDQMFGGYQ